MNPELPDFKDWLKDHCYTPSELENYLGCPFRFYAGSFLRLKPLPETDVEMTPAEVGQAFHKILERFFANKRDLTAIAEEHLAKFRKNRVGLSPALFEKKKGAIQRTLSAFLEKEEQRLSSGNLTPSFMEWSFGEGKVPPLEIPFDSRRISIKGRIDRIDLDRRLRRFLVIDYKTGSSRITGAAIERGESLQLPLYILAVQRLLLPDFQPIGALYYQMSDLELKEGILHTERIPEGLKIHPRSSSLIPPTRWEALFERTGEKVREIVGRIEKQEFTPTPDNCDSYCPFKEICLL